MLRWLVFLFALLLALPAYSHGDWYPDECCHDRDCYHAEDWEVEIREDGYWLVRDQKLIPFGDYRIKTGNIGEGFHLCRVMLDMSRFPHCVFPPGPGS